MNTTNKFKKQLLSFIHDYLQESIDFDEFMELYYDFYIECEDEDVYDLSEKDSDFFYAIQEKMDWTSTNPDNESRQYGWINKEEYFEWLQKEWSVWQKNLDQ